MSIRRRRGRMKTERLIGFSDAVMAIAITLLVIDLRIPAGLSEADFGSALVALGPELFSFLLSFLVIGRFWISHHRLFQHVRRHDDRILVLNAVFLLSVAFLPFPTAVLGDYLHYRSAMIFYAISIALAGLLFSLLWVHAAYVGGLIADDFDPRLRRFLLLRFLSVPAVFLLSVPVALTGQLHATAAIWILLPPLIRVILHRLRLRAGD